MPAGPIQGSQGGRLTSVLPLADHWRTVPDSTARQAEPAGTPGLRRGLSPVHVQELAKGVGLESHHLHLPVERVAFLYELLQPQQALEGDEA